MRKEDLSIYTTFNLCQFDILHLVPVSKGLVLHIIYITKVVQLRTLPYMSCNQVRIARRPGLTLFLFLTQQKKTKKNLPVSVTQTPSITFCNTIYITQNKNPKDPSFNVSQNSQKLHFIKTQPSPGLERTVSDTVNLYNEQAFTLTRT